jgi:hypothetical protein
MAADSHVPSLQECLQQTYFGECFQKAILGEKLFWVKSYFGRKAILGEKLFWVKSYFG